MKMNFRVLITGFLMTSIGGMALAQTARPRHPPKETSQQGEPQETGKAVPRPSPAERPQAPERPAPTRPSPADRVPHDPAPVIRTERYSIIEIDGMSFIPNDVCLADLPYGYYEFRSYRSRVYIDRDLAFCDWRTYWGSLRRCNFQPQPQSYVVPDSNYWTAGSASVTLSNQGGSKKVSVVSQEVQKLRTFQDVSSTIEPNCYEPAQSYWVTISRYSVEREVGTSRDISRTFVHRERVLVPGMRLLREPVWSAVDQDLATGKKVVTEFELDPQPFETQLEHSFTASLIHRFGSEPQISFRDEFFSHEAKYGNIEDGGTISIFSRPNPIQPPSVSISGKDTGKKTPRIEPLTIQDPRLAQLLKLSPDMKTQYTFFLRVERDKFGPNEDLGTVIVPVLNHTNQSVLKVDLETAMAQAGTKFRFDRKKNDYKIKVSVAAARADTKFVQAGQSSRSQEIELKVEKLK